MTAELSNPFTVSVYADNSPSEATQFSPTNGYADAAQQMVRKAFTISIHGVFVCVCVLCYLQRWRAEQAWCCEKVPISCPWNTSMHHGQCDTSNTNSASGTTHILKSEDGSSFVLYYQLHMLAGHPSKKRNEKGS